MTPKQHTGHTATVALASVYLVELHVTCYNYGCAKLTHWIAIAGINHPHTTRQHANCKDRAGLLEAI